MREQTPSCHLQIVPTPQGCQIPLYGGGRGCSGEMGNINTDLLVQGKAKSSPQAGWLGNQDQGNWHLKSSLSCNPMNTRLCGATADLPLHPDGQRPHGTFHFGPPQTHRIFRLKDNCTQAYSKPLCAAKAAQFRYCCTGCLVTARSNSHLQFGVIVQPTQSSRGQARGVGTVSIFQSFFY